MKKFELQLTVDNNRYGCYYKCYARKKFIIESTDIQTAYFSAARELRKLKRYKSCSVQDFENIGHHDINEWSINFEKGKEV